jgi:hypothetical protein
MRTKQKRAPREHKSEKLARQRQEEALDEALRNTFPASDPVSIEQPARPDPNSETCPKASGQKSDQ